MRTARLLTVSCSARVGDVDPHPRMQTLPPDADPPRIQTPVDADPLSLDAASWCFQHKSLCHGLHGYQCNCSHMTTKKKTTLSLNTKDPKFKQIR